MHGNQVWLSISEVTKQFDQNFKKIFSNCIDVFPAELIAGNYFLQNNYPADFGLITHHPKPIQTVAYHLILSKSVPGNRLMMERY